MKAHLSNAAYGVADYASYPLGMLLVAPIVLHRLGPADYGLWMVATAVASAGGIIASGFCDANTQRVAYLRGRGRNRCIPDVVRNIMCINLALGVLLATGIWIAAPPLARHAAVSSLTPAAECLACIRIAGAMVLLRAIDSVGVSTHRAFEQYGRTIRISIAARLLTLASAALLAWMHYGITAILAASSIWMTAGAFLQLRGLSAYLEGSSVWPAFHRGESRKLLRRGIFLWLLTLGSVVFGQFDRIVLGASLGTLAVAPYALCVQFTQPISGLTASALHFVFPYLSGRVGVISHASLNRRLAIIFSCNFIIVACGAGALLLVGDRLIYFWAGAAVARQAAAILPPIVLGAALMGLSVTGTYAMLALKLFREVAFLSLTARGAMLLLMLHLLHHSGVHGLASARAFYGATALLVYLPVLFRSQRKSADPIATTSLVPEGPTA